MTRWITAAALIAGSIPDLLSTGPARAVVAVEISAAILFVIPAARHIGAHGLLGEGVLQRGLRRQRPVPPLLLLPRGCGAKVLDPPAEVVGRHLRIMAAFAPICQPL